MYIFIHSVFCFYKSFVFNFSVLVCVYTYLNSYVYVYLFIYYIYIYIYIKKFHLCLGLLVYVCSFVCVSLDQNDR